MRLSKILANAKNKAAKGKNIDKEVAAICDVIKGAVKAYKGSSKGAFEANKVEKLYTAYGRTPMSVLDDESLIVTIASAHKQAVITTCQNKTDENYSLNAELAREVATNSIILGACFWLTTESEANSLL